MSNINYKELFGAGHTTVIGTTRHGKSYFTKKALLKQSAAVIYYNTKLENNDFEGYVEIDKYIDIQVLTNLIKKKAKMVYNPQHDTLESELIVLSQLLLQLGNLTEKNYLLLSIDEVHLFNNDKNAIKQLIKLATIGVSLGVRLVNQSQRPAYIHNSLMTQSEKMVIFNINMEKDYFRRYNMPYDDIVNEIQGRKYYFVEYDFNKISKAQKI